MSVFLRYFLYSFRSLYFSSQNESKRPEKVIHYDELVKTANLLFGTLEESYIWLYAGRLLEKSCSTKTTHRKVRQVGHGSPHFLEMCKLTAFLLEVLSVDSSSDMQGEHLPSLLAQTADLLHTSFDNMNADCVLAGIDLCFTILKKILPFHGSEELAGSWSNPSEGEEAVETSSGEFHSPPSSPALVSSSQHQAQLLEHAVGAIQQLLAKLLNPGIILSPRTALLHRAAQVLAIRTTNSLPPLEELLEQCLDPKNNNKSVAIEKQVFPTTEMCKVELTEELELSDTEQQMQFLPVIKQCCTLLKELAAFPTFCAASVSLHQTISCSEDWDTLPEWLQLLCLTICLLSETMSCSQQIYLTGATTLLDLTALTLSMIPTTYWKLEQAPKTRKEETPPHTFSVILLPVVTPTQLLTLLHKSNVFQMLARKLWEGVGCTSESQQICTELLHQLHTLAPPALSHVAEDVVLSSLSQQMKNEDNCSSAVEKFTVLWHLGRDLEPIR